MYTPRAFGCLSQRRAHLRGEPRPGILPRDRCLALYLRYSPGDPSWKASGPGARELHSTLLLPSLMCVVTVGGVVAPRESIHGIERFELSVEIDSDTQPRRAGELPQVHVQSMSSG